MLMWDSKSNQDFWQGYFMPALAGQEVTFSLWAWDEDANGRLRLAMTFYDETGASLGNEFSNQYSDDVTGNAMEWFQLTHTATAPEGAVSVRAWVRMYDVAPADGTEWESAWALIDSWSLVTGQ